MTLQGNYHHKVKVPDGSAVKNLPAKQEMQETKVRSLDQEDPLEDETSTYSTILFFFFLTPLFLTRESHGERSLVA